MKALILNGEIKGDISLAKVDENTKELLIEQGYEVESILLYEKKIGECLGCFGCWVKTPGICVIDDYGRSLIEEIIKSDIVVFLTPTVYGGYSSEMKKVLDRIIPLMLPFFTKVNREVHHKKRYQKYPKAIVLGMMIDEDKLTEEVFNNLIKRNALNWYNSFTGGVIQNSTEEATKHQIIEKLKTMGVAVC